MDVHGTPSEGRRFTPERINSVNCVFCVLDKGEKEEREQMFLTNHQTAVLIIHAFLFLFILLIVIRPFSNFSSTLQKDFFFFFRI